MGDFSYRMRHYPHRTREQQVLHALLHSETEAPVCNIIKINAIA